MAGLGWRKFGAGEVLTANNFQSYAVDQSVQRYAGTAARGSAIGTAVSEGMMSWLDDTNVVEAYDGAAWNSLAYATAIPTNIGMDLVKTQTVGTAVSSVTVTGAFSSTYENYRIIYTGGFGSTDAYINLVFGASATGYYAGLVGNNYAGTQSFASDNNAARFTYAGSFSTTKSAMDLTALQPNIASRTMITSNLTTPTAGYSYTGFLADNTQHTAFTLGTSAGTMTGGTIRVYGMKK
jgi:hypothetical protein